MGALGKRKVLLIGAGGFGRNHFNELNRLQTEGLLEFAAVSDVRIPDAAMSVIREKGIRHYGDYRDMLAAEKGADIVIVSTPISFHAPMSIDAMEAGYHVLLEKPPGATIQEVDRIADAARRTGKRCAVNFMTPSSKAQRTIADTVASGALGEVKRIKGLSILLRTEAYFRRTPWAGKLSVNGNLVLDGSFHNPAAHLLYSMVNLAQLLSGEATGQPAEPVRVTAEMYHASAIESDDTTAMRVEMSDGTELTFYVTLCAREIEPQRIRIEGTRGALEWNYANQVTVYADGEERVHDCGEGTLLERRYRNLIQSLDGLDERLDVSIESARLFTLVANGAFESAGRIKPIPAAHIRRPIAEGEPAGYIEGIETAIREAFHSGRLFAEMGVPWAEPTEPFELRDYRTFPQRFRFEL
ncbi:Gfo/Idh/MocA family oxidoreductase [Paenibacillus sp. CC-CFT747]|nr:Gfo/Idh/MocA family oxidoreductase [Paenibacillus sp. CC-CFT747]